jgi:hypothetical protein
MSLRLHYGGALVALASLLTITPPSFAQTSSADPIAPLSAAQTIDKTTGFGTYWDELSLSSDVKWLFGIEYEDKKIEKKARNFEALYLDTLRQYDDDHPTIRTRDLPSPYTTSVMSLEPESTSSGGATVPVPPSDTGNYPAEPPAPVSGMW